MSEATEKDPAVTAERQAVDGVRVMFGVGGLIAVIIGVLIMVNPLQSAEFFAKVLAVILAIYLVVMGVVYLGTAIFSKTVGGWARTGNILLGLLYIIAAVILFANLGLASTVLLVFIAILIGIMWIVEGVLSFTTVKSSGHPVLAIVYGIVSIIAGGVLIFSSALGIAVLVLMIGISLIVLGVVQIVRAFTIKAV
ncbi:MAG: HdeD family acid-resistance protein [Leucobacter sp.]